MFHKSPGEFQNLTAGWIAQDDNAEIQAWTSALRQVMNSEEAEWWCHMRCVQGAQSSLGLVGLRVLMMLSRVKFIRIYIIIYRALFQIGDLFELYCNPCRYTLRYNQTWQLNIPPS